MQRPRGDSTRLFRVVPARTPVIRRKFNSTLIPQATAAIGDYYLNNFVSLFNLFFYFVCMKRAWTEDDLNRLKELAAKHTITELARILDRTSDSVRDKIRKLKLKTRGNRVRTDEYERAILLNIRHHGVSHVAKTSNISYDTLVAIQKKYQKIAQRRLASFSDNRIEKLRQKALTYATSKGQSFHDAREFASHLLLKFVENGGMFIRVDWTYSNWLRTHRRIEYADNNGTLTDFSAVAASIERDYVSINQTDDRDNEETRDRNVVLGSNEHTSEILEALCELQNLDDIDRACFILYFYFGLTTSELSLVFGVSKTRIEHRINRVFSQLRPR